MSIRILLADDHRILRQGVRAMLSAELDFEVVAEAQDGRTAVEMRQRLSPNVVVMDSGMPHLNGIGATPQVVDRVPAVPWMALWGDAGRRLVAGIFRGGAWRYPVNAT